MAAGVEEDISSESFPFMSYWEITIGSARGVRALRLTFLGELGYELHVPMELAQNVYMNLMKVGEPFGLRNAGYRAIDSLMLEKGYR